MGAPNEDSADSGCQTAPFPLWWRDNPVTPCVWPINLLTEDPRNPSGCHWFWAGIIPEMARRLGPGEELHLLVSPTSRQLHQDYGPNVHYITYPWSNERRTLRTLTEHLYSPARLPFAGIDVLSTLMAPIVNPTWSLVIHMKTMHAFAEPQSLTPAAATYRQMNYPRSARLADAIIITSESLRTEIEKLPRRRPAEAQAHLRGGGPRRLQARAIGPRRGRT